MGKELTTRLNRGPLDLLALIARATGLPGQTIVGHALQYLTTSGRQAKVEEEIRKQATRHGEPESDVVAASPSVPIVDIAIDIAAHAIPRLDAESEADYRARCRRAAIEASVVLWFDYWSRKQMMAAKKKAV